MRFLDNPAALEMSDEPADRFSAGTMELNLRPKAARADTCNPTANCQCNTLTRLIF